MNTKSLFVGVDVSSSQLDVCFMDQEERKIVPIHTYPNLPSGFKQLRQDAFAFSRIIGKNIPIVFGFESTATYHKNLQKFLENRKSKRFTIRLINPYRIKEFRKSHFKLSKTDKIDAYMIAKFLKAFPENSSTSSSPLQDSLRSLTRFRRTLVEERTRYINRLRKNLNLIYPGYRKIIGKKFTTSFLSFISTYPTPESIKNSSIPSSWKKYLALFPLAQDKLSHILTNEIIWSAERIIQLQKQIATIENEITTIMDTYFPDHILFSIPGIGKITVATIIGEIGNSVDRFPDAKHFVGYIGLYPVVYQSGKNKVFFKMTWKGNKHLKMALLLASASARKNNPLMRNFYNRIRSRGKSKKAAGGALARKLACLVYAILASGKKWDENIAFKSIKRANEMTTQNFPVVENDIIKTGRPTINFSTHNTGLPPKGNSGPIRLT